MTRLRAGLLVAAGAFLLILGGIASAFYIRVYKPIGAPLAAMSIGRVLEEKQLTNHQPFIAPSSGELTADQVRRFVAVEEAVEHRLSNGRTTLDEQRAALEQGWDRGALPMQDVLAAFGQIRPWLIDAKSLQIDAMNRERFSKAEFEWVRDQLYLAAGVRLTRLDVSAILDGERNATAGVRSSQGGPVPQGNVALAQPHAAKLEAWRALGFFGL
jgi:hypothetical protein